MVLGILWIYWIGSILAVIFGHVAISQTGKNPTLRGRGMAIAGLVLGYVGIGLLVVGILAVDDLHYDVMSGGGQASAVMISPLALRSSTQTLPLRQSGGDVISHPRRCSAAIVSGMTSPWLHSAVESGTVSISSTTSTPPRPSASRSSSRHRDTDRPCRRLECFDAPQERAADQPFHTGVLQALGKGLRLSVSGRAEWPQAIVTSEARCRLPAFPWRTTYSIRPRGWPACVVRRAVG